MGIVAKFTDYKAWPSKPHCVFNWSGDMAKRTSSQGVMPGLAPGINFFQPMAPGSALDDMVGGCMRVCCRL